MKTFTTSIFVPAKAKAQMALIEREEMLMKVRNRSVVVNDDLGLGSLDDLVEDEQFTLIVNGQCEKHHIQMKIMGNCVGAKRIMVVNPDEPEVRRLIEWRVDPTKVMSSNKGQRLQLKNFTVQDLRRMIRNSFINRESTFVSYR